MGEAVYNSIKYFLAEGQISHFFVSFVTKHISQCSQAAPALKQRDCSCERPDTALSSICLVLRLLHVGYGVCGGQKTPAHEISSGDQARVVR